jgi:hypothetical protein
MFCVSTREDDMVYRVFDTHEMHGHAFKTRSKLVARLGAWLLTKLDSRQHCFDWLSDEDFILYSCGLDTLT